MNEPQARGCDFDSESGPSSARAPESVPNDIHGVRIASTTSSSRMIEMITDDSALSAITRSIAASRGSFPMALPISTKFMPSYFRSDGSSTELSITPAGPPEPYHWFSNGAFGSSMSRLTRARVSGSCQALQHRRRPPSRTQTGRQASRPFEARSYGIDVGGNPQPLGARRLDAAEHLGHLAPVGLVGGLEMPDLGRDVGAFGNGEHLVERLEHLVAFRSLVRDVDAAVLGRRPSPARRARRWWRTGWGCTAARS